MIKSMGLLLLSNERRMKGNRKMLLIEISIFVLTALNFAVMFRSRKK